MFDFECVCNFLAKYSSRMIRWFSTRPLSNSLQCANRTLDLRNFQVLPFTSTATFKHSDLYQTTLTLCTSNIELTASTVQSIHLRTIIFNLELNIYVCTYNHSYCLQYKLYPQRRPKLSTNVVMCETISLKVELLFQY